MPGLSNSTAHEELGALEDAAIQPSPWRVKLAGMLESFERFLRAELPEYTRPTFELLSKRWIKERIEVNKELEEEANEFRESSGQMLTYTRCDIDPYNPDANEPSPEFLDDMRKRYDAVVQSLSESSSSRSSRHHHRRAS